MGSNDSKNLPEVQLSEITYLWQLKYISAQSEAIASNPVLIYENSYYFELRKRDGLEIKLYLKKPTDSVLKFRCVTALLDTLDIEIHFQTKDAEIGKETNDVVLWSVPYSVLKNELGDFFRKHGLSVIFRISQLKDNTPTAAVSSSLVTARLSSDIGKLYSERTNYDVEIWADAKVCFKAHRLILSARCPVFAAMFRHNSTERIKGKIQITDIEAPIVDSMLHYIYTGKIKELDSNSAVPLTKAADKYDLPEMKQACLEYLLTNLTTANICDAIILAEICNISALKEECHSFLIENSAEILESEEWRKLRNDHPDIVNSILVNVLLLSKKKF